ncbi:polysaccharide biosynthesis protein [Nostocoides vanveenii]|uniref:polysaccharide biosynthesis protein n=1 Tax=Nostocoides vanveenii TaxID=330835 RepID=UPI0031DFBBA5
MIPEACQLVLQAAAIGADGRVMVLDMGVPVKILDVANTLITQYGKRNIDVVFTGLRPGEKLTEELFDTQEKASPSSHPLVTHVGVAAISPDDVRQDFEAQADALAWLRRCAVSSGTSA